MQYLLIWKNIAEMKRGAQVVIYKTCTRTDRDRVRYGQSLQFAIFSSCGVIDYCVSRESELRVILALSSFHFSVHVQLTTINLLEMEVLNQSHSPNYVYVELLNLSLSPNG